MRQSNNGRRSRGGRPTRRPGPLKSQTFDSNGPEVRIRGNAHQVLEKYQNLARDAQTNGDRVLAESYYQFAEHYYRIVHESTDPESPGSQRSHQRDDRDDGGRQESDQENARDSRSEPRDSRSDQSSNGRQRSDQSRSRQPTEEREAEASSDAAPPVNGETADADRDGLERALGAKTLVLSSGDAPTEAGKTDAGKTDAGRAEEGKTEESKAKDGKEAGGKEEEGKTEDGSGGEAAPEEAKSSRSNGSRSSRSRTRYRRSSSRSTTETEESAPQRRQFPMPADANDQAEEGETQDS
ncbi:MAG: DUF4167 domain-containing protein [Kiloniellales bacterium]